MRRGEKRSKIQRDNDRSTIARLILQGWSQTQVAQFMELSQPQISKELKLIREQWRHSAVRDHDLEKGRILNKLQLLQHELWGAWDSSKGKQETSLVEKLESTTGTRTKQQKRIEPESGNPSYLRAVLDCVKEEAKILDMYPSYDKGAANTTVEQRSSDNGLSEDTVEAIRNRILGITNEHSHAPAGAAEPSNPSPTFLSTEVG